MYQHLLDMLPRQNWVVKLILLSLTLNLQTSFTLKKQITIATIIMQIQPKLFLYFTKINTKLFSVGPKIPLIPKVSPSPKIKKTFFLIISMRWCIIINTKNYIIHFKVIIKTAQTFSSDVIP